MYERAGGEAFFEQLTRRFYSSVESDELLRPLYPDDPGAFETSRFHLQLFLVQFFGGPPLYRQQRGEARLAQRHSPFRITRVERDRWVAHMSAAVREGGLAALDESRMLSYFASAATAMVNAE